MAPATASRVAMPRLAELIVDRDRYHSLVHERAVERGEKYKEMSMSAQGVAFILEMLKKRKAHAVLDFGTGFSTATIGRWLASRRAAYLGVEHDAEWLSWVNDVVVPAFMRPSPSHLQLQTRDGFIEEFKGSKWDAIIVDHGPTLDARAADIPWLTTFLKPDGIMLFDDWRPKHEGRCRRALAKTKGKWNIDAAEHTRRFAKDKAIGWATRS